MTDYRTARGWLTSGERDVLFYEAKRLAVTQSSAVIVNIGVEYSASVHCLLGGIREAQESFALAAPLVYAIDIDNSKVEGDPQAILITGDSGSRVTARKVKGEISLLFIDGGHSFEQVSKDISVWAERVVPGGTMMFHDYSDLEMHAGVKKAVDKWYLKAQWEWYHVATTDTLSQFRRQAA